MVIYGFPHLISDHHNDISFSDSLPADRPIISHASEIVEPFLACLNPILWMAALLSPTFCVF
jgi:hypothetical protein